MKTVYCQGEIIFQNNQVKPKSVFAPLKCPDLAVQHLHDLCVFLSLIFRKKELEHWKYFQLVYDKLSDAFLNHYGVEGTKFVQKASY